MKTSTKTKTAIVIGELPSASNASNPLNLHSAAVVASVRGGLASGGINPFPNPFEHSPTTSIQPHQRHMEEDHITITLEDHMEEYYNPFVPNVPKWSKAFWNVFFSLASSPVITWHRPLPNVPKAP
ncbi:MAG: hypothetical protein H9534_00080 [Dolichospermum circinale Clear-D4]|nr:hypothetical protein [Dolichospermum circinale Clear-D4]